MNLIRMANFLDKVLPRSCVVKTKETTKKLLCSLVTYNVINKKTNPEKKEKIYSATELYQENTVGNGFRLR